MKKFLLGLLLALSGTLFAQSGVISDTVQDPTGKPVRHALVYVCALTSTGQPCSPTSSIYSDTALSLPLLQPYVTDNFGNFTVWVAPGNYQVQAMSLGGNITTKYYTVVSPTGALTGFNSIGSGTSNNTGMVVGNGSTLDVSGTGTINANKLMGVALSGITGLVKMAAGVPSAAAAGTDYVLPNGNISGTAANVSGTPALPNGTTATTQSAGDNSTKLATTAYLDGQTEHQRDLPRQCNDISGSGTVQSCNTSPSFTPAAKDCIIYNTTTANTGTGLTLNVNGLGAKSVAKWLSSATLAIGDVPANKPQELCYDGTFWNLMTIGNAPSGSGGTVTGPGSSTAGDVALWNNGTGTLLSDSSKPLAGTGAAIPTGPASSTTGDVVQYTGAAGQQSDSGILAINIATKATTQTLTNKTINCNANTISNIPHVYSFINVFGGTSWAVPASITEFAAGSTQRRQMDLTCVSQFRLVVSTNTNADAGAKIGVQYSTNGGSTWTYLESGGTTTSEVAIGTAGDPLTGAWTNIAALAQADVQLRIIGEGGTATLSANFRLIDLQVK